ncbi:hypothetical protein FGO68_gene12595 [Halteria grandinella]|uniref:Uncharacterized protein n=1 Tax=Halteria grandinella TaxID=5974 RepID=A0A8J8NY43_HALGN|nr:hypothetical protein FGO68_gene12595 [Halteria grandinella]
MPLEDCGGNHYKGFDADMLDMYKINTFKCMKNQGVFDLQGDYYSPQFRYLEIRLYKCLNGSQPNITCKSPSDINNFFAYTTLSIAMVNSYFDFSDYTRRDLSVEQDVESNGVIKQYIDDRFFFEIDPTRSKKADIYLMKSQANLQDDYIQLGQQETIDFVEISNKHVYENSYNPADGYVVSFYLRYDSQYNTYNRQIYSAMDLLGDVGGLYQSLFYIGYLLINFFSHRLFISAILKHLYQTKHFTDQYQNINIDTPRKGEDGPNEGQEAIPTKKKGICNIFRKANIHPTPPPLYNRETVKTQCFDDPSNNIPGESGQASILNQSQLTTMINLIPPQSQTQVTQANDGSIVNSMRAGVSIDKELQSKDKKSLEEWEVRAILMNLVNRRRFLYKGKDIIAYLLRCLCFRSAKLRKYKGPKEDWDQTMRKHYHFKEGEDKLFDELDVITLMKSMRRVKLLTQTLLSQSQKMVLKFQRKNIIESDSSSGDSDTNNKFDTINLIESPNPMMRFVVLSKIKKMIQAMKNTAINDTDKRLLRGLFIKHIKDFDEEYREKMKNTSLIDRLMSGIRRMSHSDGDLLVEAQQIQPTNIDEAHYESDSESNMRSQLRYNQRQRNYQRALELRNLQNNSHLSGTSTNNLLTQRAPTIQICFEDRDLHSGSMELDMTDKQEVMNAGLLQAYQPLLIDSNSFISSEIDQTINQPSSLRVREQTIQEENQEEGYHTFAELPSIVVHPPHNNDDVSFRENQEAPQLHPQMKINSFINNRTKGPSIPSAPIQSYFNTGEFKQIGDR